MSAIAKALVEAQKKIGLATKDSTNPHFKNKYASLESVSEACRQPLSEQGIAVCQTILRLEGELYLKTSLLHISGESVESLCPLILTQPTMQALGSAISYARRYSLAAACGVIQADDDGEEDRKSFVLQRPEPRVPDAPGKAPSRAPKGRPLTEGQKSSSM